MSLSRVEQQHEMLAERLETETRQLFGEADDDAPNVAMMMREGFREELPPIPKLTAFDLLDEINWFICFFFLAIQRCLHRLAHRNYVRRH